MLNLIAVEGRLVADPEMRYTPDGTPVANFRIAVDRSFKNKAGEREADFFNVVAWRGLGEAIANHVTKGRLISIVGRLQSRNYETQEGGKRTAVEIVASEFHFLDSKRDGNAPAGASDHDEAELPDDLPF